jgi:hypothetical protein
MWRDSTISRATELGATKMTTSWIYGLGEIIFKILD